MPPPPTMVDTTAIPDTTISAEDTHTDTADTTAILMADTDTLTITASVPLMPNPRLMPRPIPPTCMPATSVDTTDILMPTVPIPMLPTAPIMPLPLTTTVDTTAIPDTDTPPDTTAMADTTAPDTDILMPDTDTGILASVPLMLSPPCLILTVAPKVLVDTDSPMLMLPTITDILSVTGVKLRTAISEDFMQ